MDHRERVAATFRFAPADRAPYDLMEGVVWPELAAHMAAAHGLPGVEAVLDFFDTDFRWAWPPFVGALPDGAGVVGGIVQPAGATGPPLADAHTVADVERAAWADPAWWGVPDFADLRRQWPGHAIVSGGGWLALFWSACEAFGVGEALEKMAAEPAVFEAYVARRSAFCVDLHRRLAPAMAGTADIYYLGDDVASKDTLMMSPSAWRRLIKPYLAAEVRIARAAGLPAMLHLCGAVRPILGDLIDIGVDALLVFQTSARDMAPEGIARDFGGRMVFYGGLDVQQLLTFGTPDDVRREVRRNLAAFERYGGYVVANAHHCISDIRPENVFAMLEAAGWAGPPSVSA